MSRYLRIAAKDRNRQASVEAVLGTHVSDEPTTASETHETPEQRLRRRQREKSALVQASREKVIAAEKEKEEIQHRLAKLFEAHAFHQQTYARRTQMLLQYYAKRQAVYLRGGLHGLSRDGEPPRAPEIILTEWSPEPFPAITADGQMETA